MCKAINIRYSCRHSNYFRLSTCRGIVTIIPATTFEVKDGKLTSSGKKGGRTVEPFPACTSTYSLTVRSSHECGGCQLKQLEHSLQARLKEADQRVQIAQAACLESKPPTIEQTTQVALAEALRRDEGEFHDQKLFDARKTVGSKCNTVYAALGTQHKQSALRKTSLLRCEVFPEDVRGEEIMENACSLEKFDSSWNGPVEDDNRGSLSWDDDEEDNTFVGIDVNMSENFASSGEDDEFEDGEEPPTFDENDHPSEHDQGSVEGGNENQVPASADCEYSATTFGMPDLHASASFIGKSSYTSCKSRVQESRRDSVTDLLPLS